MAAERMCTRLEEAARRERQILISTIVVVILLDGTAFVFVFLGLQPFTARILVALGNCTAHSVWSCLAIVLLLRGSRKTTRQKLWILVVAKGYRGLLCCLACTSTAAIASLVFLKVPAMDLFLLVCAPII
jgi:hypothetical protein